MVFRRWAVAAARWNVYRHVRVYVVCVSAAGLEEEWCAHGVGHKKLGYLDAASSTFGPCHAYQRRSFARRAQ